MNEVLLMGTSLVIHNRRSGELEAWSFPNETLARLVAESLTANVYHLERAGQ